MRKAAIQSWGTIMSGIMSSAGLSLDLLGVFNNAPLLVKWLPLIMLLFFFVFVWWHWRDQGLRIQQLEDKHPTIKLNPKIDGKSVFLEIMNTGGELATFEARITEWKGLEDINHKMEYFYNTRWEQWDIQKTKPIDARIKVGGSNRAPIIDDNGLASMPEDIIQYRGVSIPDSRASTFWQAKVRINTVLQFTIQILSEPPLKTPFQQIYDLSIDDAGVWKIGESK